MLTHFCSATPGKLCQYFFVTFLRFLPQSLPYSLLTYTPRLLEIRLYLTGSACVQGHPSRGSSLPNTQNPAFRNGHPPVFSGQSAEGPTSYLLGPPPTDLFPPCSFHFSELSAKCLSILPNQWIVPFQLHSAFLFRIIFSIFEGPVAIILSSLVL